MSVPHFDRCVGKRVIHRAVTPELTSTGRWKDLTEDRVVVLLAVAKCWAMVRRPRAMPYVCHVKELRTHD